MANQTDKDNVERYQTGRIALLEANITDMMIWERMKFTWSVDLNVM